jgi:hypothetical protein
MAQGTSLASRILVRRQTPCYLSLFAGPNPNRLWPSTLRSYVLMLSPPRLPQYHPESSSWPSSLYPGPARWSFSTLAKAARNGKGNTERQRREKKWEKRRPKSKHHTGEASKTNFESRKKWNQTNKLSESAKSSNDTVSTATSLIENWEEKEAQGGAFSRKAELFRNKIQGSSCPNRQQDEHAIKQMRFYEYQQVFYKRLSDYRKVWYPSYVGSINNSDIPVDWETALNFHHPPLSMVSWKMVVDSEEMFRLLCTIHHDLFVVSASFADVPTVQSDLNSHEKQTPPLLTSAEPAISPQDLMCILLPFWENMRKERRVIVNHYRPQSSDTHHLSGSSSKNDTSGNGTWMSWIASTISIGGTKAPDTQLEVTAHEDIAFGPRKYHYSELVGQLFFHCSPLVASKENITEQEDDDAVDEAISTSTTREQQAMLEKRANMIQSLIDQTSSDDNLTDKIIRLLVRAYAEVGTLECAQQAERAFNTYPKYQKNLLRHVLKGYLKVVENEVRDFKKNPGDKSKDIGQSAILATQRICELASTKHSSEVSEFQSCSLIALQALTAMAPFSKTFPGYFDRVHSLGVLKFGPKTWEAIIHSKDDECGTAALRLDLHPNDHMALNLLVVIYGWDDLYLGRAIRILDIAFENFSKNELKRSVKHETFHAILESLLNHQKRRIYRESSDAKNANGRPSTNIQFNPELDLAFRLVDRMMTEDAWFPVRQTFFPLFRLASISAFDSDRVRARLETCRSYCSEPVDRNVTQSTPSLSYPLSPLTAAKFALNACIVAAEKTGGIVPRSEPDPAERAWDILSSLQIASRPLFLPAEAVPHIYDSASAPDTSTYILVLKVCSRIRSKKANEVTLKVLDIIEKEGLLMEGSVCSALLRAINNSLDMEHRVTLTKRAYQLATKDEKNLEGFIRKIFDNTFEYFRRRHPSLYEKHLVDLFQVEDR